MNIIDELFFSEQRKKLDTELREIIATNTDSLSLRENLLYHFGFENSETKPSLSHSKRLRAYLCFRFSEHLNIPLEKIIPLAATIELFHNATLIIDDIQDNDTIRCNRLSLWKKANFTQAINAAIFLSNLSQAYFHQKRSEYNYHNYSFEITRMINKIASGQQIDIESCVNKDKTLEQYEKMVEGKTGVLISLSCKMGYMPFDYDLKKSKLIDDFSKVFSILYQIKDDIDDVFHYMKNEKSLDDSNVIFYLGFTQQQLSMINIENEILKSLKKYTSNKKDELESSIKTMLVFSMVKNDLAYLINSLTSIDFIKKI